MLLLVAACAWLPDALDGLALREPEACAAEGSGDTSPTCDDRPELCGLDTRTLPRGADPERAYHLVFVPEGFPAEELDAFEEQVESLVEDLDADPDGLVARAPDLFAIHTVALASASDELRDADGGDTALGGCFRPCHAESWCLEADDGAARLAAASAIPAPDVVIVLLNTPDGRANVTERARGVEALPVVHLSLGDDAAVLTHELAHAVVGLADEYSEGLGDYGLELWPWQFGPVPLYDGPNLDVAPDGGRWFGAVEGAVEGGAFYDTGIWHPTDHCRMLASHEDAFCPVCSAEIDAVLARRAGLGNDGPPVCAVAAPTDPAGWRYGYSLRVSLYDHDGAGEVRIDADDGEVRTSTTITLDGAWYGSIEWHGEASDLGTLTATCIDTEGAAAEVVVRR